MAEIVKIPKGQPFVVFVPLVILNADGSKESVEASTVTGVDVSLKCACDEPQKITPTTYDHYLVLKMPATLNVAEYAIVISATLPSGRDFSLRIKRAFGIVDWDSQSNWRDYLVGDHIELCDQPFIAGYAYTDAQYEEIKQQMLAKIAELELAIEAEQAAKERYEQAVLELDDIAKQGGNPNATNSAILQAVGGIDFSTLAKEQTLTEGVAAIRDDIAHINIDTSDLAKENTSQQILQIISPVGAELETGKAEIVNAINSKGGSSTTSETLSNLASDILVLVPSTEGITFAQPPTTLRDVIEAGTIETYKTYASSLPYSTYEFNFSSNIQHLFPSLKKLYFYNYASASQAAICGEKASVIYIYAPKCIGATGNSPFIGGQYMVCLDIPGAEITGSYFMRNGRSLRHLFFNGNGFSANTAFYDSGAGAVLYDIRKTLPHTVSCNYGRWRCDTALSASSASLLDRNEWDDDNEPTNTFVSNRDKFLWYFRNHFMTSFADMTGQTSPTLTIYSGIYDIISAEADIVAHFASLNWTIARG